MSVYIDRLKAAVTEEKLAPEIVKCISLRQVDLVSEISYMKLGWNILSLREGKRKKFQMRIYVLLELLH